MIDKINIDKKFSLFSDHWQPKIAAEMNGQEFKLVKFQGEYPFHAHEAEDEMFFCWKGEFFMDFEAHDSIEIKQGEAIVIPKGVVHRPRAEEECQVFLIEPAGLKNNGTATVEEKYDAPNGVRV